MRKGRRVGEGRRAVAARERGRRACQARERKTKRLATSSTLQLLALIACPGAPLAGADRVFADGAALTIPLEAASQRIVTADLNHDGLLDVVCLHSSASTVSVHLRRPGELLDVVEPFGSRSYTVGLGPVDLVAGDLDRDEDTDLAVVSSGSSSISLLLNDGAGHFLAGTALAAGLGPRDIDLADFDSDGNLDLVTAQLHSDDLRLYFGDGAGGFVDERPLNVGDNAHSVAVEDFDGDAVPDVAVAHTGAVLFLKGDGGRAFTGGVETRTTGPVERDDPRLLAAADFDGDGRAELAVLTDRGALLYLELSQEPGFEVTVVDALADNVMNVNASVWSFLLALDFDGDGRTDLAVQQERSGIFGFRIYRGAGDGTFRLSQEFFVDPTQLLALAIADIDGDGFLDSLTTSTTASGHELRLVRGTGPAELGLPTYIRLEERPRDLRALVGRDGSVQLAVLSSRSVHLLEPDGRGALLDPRSFELEAIALQAMVVADLDRDGDEELALSDLAAGQVLLVDQADDGALSVAAVLPVNETPDLIAASDVDGDGWSDLVLTHIASTDLSLLLRPGSEAPPPPVGVGVGEIVTAIAAGDLDGDRRVDLVVGTRSGLRVLFGDGNGSFPDATAIDDAPSALELQVVDIDGNGAAELIAAAGRELIIVHDAASRVGPPRRDSVAIGPGPHAFELRDLDGDGLLDVALTESRELSAVRVFRGRLEGGFGAAETYPLGIALRGLALADLDNDGAIDLAVTDFVGQAVVVLRGAARPGATFRRGDVNLDGQTGIADAVQILERLFAGGEALPCPDAADTDDDGKLALADAVGLLVYLFQGGGAPVSPGPHTCGEDPTDDELSCSGVCP